MMSAKSSVMPPKRKLEKLVIATALRVKKAAKTVTEVANAAMKAERMTTIPVIEPSTKPATISKMGSFLRRRLSHSLPSSSPRFVN